MTSGADAPTPREPKAGEIVAIDGREATFLYSRNSAAIVRFHGETDTRVVPLAKLRRRAS